MKHTFGLVEPGKRATDRVMRPPLWRLLLIFQKKAAGLAYFVHPGTYPVLTMSEGECPVGKISKKMLVAFVIATLVGACMHFVYAMLPNPVTALVSPINESLWEHLKILFWPYLVASLLLTRGGEKGCRAPWLLSLLVQSAAMLAGGYLYHIVLTGDALAVDVGLYVLCMAAGFVLPGLFHSVADKPGLRDAVTLAVVALAAMIVLFTFLPPDHILFADLSGVNTWTTIPYC